MGNNNDKELLSIDFKSIGRESEEEILIISGIPLIVCGKWRYYRLKSEKT